MDAASSTILLITQSRFTTELLGALLKFKIIIVLSGLLHATAKSLSTSNVQSPKIVFKDIEELLFSPTKSEEGSLKVVLNLYLPTLTVV